MIGKLKKVYDRCLLIVEQNIRLIGWRWRALYRTKPISQKFGLEFGKPIDRYYIEQFLASQATRIRGVVLEVGDNHYTSVFGGSNVSQSHVLHAVPGNATATLVGDLATGAGIPENAFDCIILTQVIPFIYNIHGAIFVCIEALKPGGVLLLTVPGISQISRYDMDRWGDYWRFTSLGLRRLLEEQFPADSVSISTYGNALMAAAFLYGIDASRLTPAEFQIHDPDYELIIAAGAIKPVQTVA